MKRYKVTYDYKSYIKSCKRITSYRKLEYGRYIRDMGTPELSLKQALQACIAWPQFPAGKRFIKTYASGPALVSYNRHMVSIMYNFKLEKEGANDEINP